MNLWIIWVRSTIKTPTLRLKQLIGPKGSLPARPHGPKSATPPFPRNQTKLPDRPGADIGRGAACEPLTARTGLEPSKAREKGTLPGSAECILGRPLKGCILVINTSRIAEVSLGISSILFRTGWGRLRAIPAWVLVFCSSGFAQAPNPTFHVDDDITLIDVQVVDTATGQAIRDLRQSDFVVLAENWLPRDIAVFEAENTPLDLAVVLDLSGIPQPLRFSGPVLGRPDPVALGLSRMLDDLSPQDRVAVVSFSSRPHLVSGLTSDRVSLRDAIKDAMNERQRVRERTAAVREAVAFASRVFDGQPRIGRRRAVLLITHNRSTDDDMDGAATIDALRGADAVLTALVVPQFYSTGHMQPVGGGIGIPGREIATWPPRGHEEIEELPDLGCGRPDRRVDGWRDLQRRVEQVLGNCPGPITQPLPHRLLWGTGANGSGHVDWGSAAGHPRRRRASSGAIENTVIPRRHHRNCLYAAACLARQGEGNVNKRGLHKRTRLCENSRGGSCVRWKYNGVWHTSLERDARSCSFCRIQ